MFKIKANISDDWKYDKLDSLDFAKNAYAEMLATRKALSRCNTHLYRYGIHRKTTTLRRGYIGELAVHDYFTKHRELGYKVIPLISFNHNNFSFTQSYIPSISGFQFQEHLLDIEVNNKNLWKKKGEYCARIFLDELYQQQHHFHEKYNDIYDRFRFYIKDVEKTGDPRIPTCPYEIQAQEHFKRLLENFESRSATNNEMKSLGPEIAILSKFLEKESNSFFRDASPINFILPNRSINFPYGLPRNIKRFGDSKRIRENFCKWLHDVDIDSIKLLSRNIFQVDFEQVGLKQTNDQDDIIHILALNNSPSLRGKYIKTHLKSLSKHEKLKFYMTMIFRTPREGARRIKFLLDDSVDKEESYCKHYNYLDMNDDFRHLFEYAIISTDECDRLSRGKYKFPNLKSTFKKTLDWLNENESCFFNLISLK